MGNIIKIVGLLFSLVSFSSCGNGNYKDILITGIVKDAKSKLPLSNVSVKIKCWAYSTQKWESKFTVKEVNSDFHGKFKVQFSEGEALDISAILDEYNIFEKSITLNKSNIELDVELNKSK